MSIFSKLFGDPNQKILDKLQPIVEEINQLEPEIKKLSDEGLKTKTDEFKKRLTKGESLDALLPEACAVAREAIRRVVGERAYDVQLMAAIVLHQGQIAEQKTGEGKTLSAAITLYLNGLTGQGCHLITVNDYLARRDTGWYGRALNFLGLSVACIVHDQAFIFDPSHEDQNTTDERLKHLRLIPRKESYLADVTYGTNNEFGFDYLRDNMTQDTARMVQRPLHFAIIDEVDSILIDEARTPLIISMPAAEAADLYYRLSELTTRLRVDEDYNIDEKMRATTLTEDGQEKLARWLGKDPWAQGDFNLVHHIEAALKAKTLFQKDRDYVVRDDQVVIVDEFTGRLMFGRRYSEGLHQAIEAKEGVKIQRESRTLATITFQNFFRLYEKLAGMTGTAVTSAEEFAKVYKLEVVVISTNKPMIRKYLIDRIYRSEDGKFKALARDVRARHEKGQPVLIGTISIEKNELLSKYLEREGISFQILNAKNHAKEAETITQAGRFGAVTLATNMAGRGVDIVLGGEPLQKEEHKKVVELGGLHVIGTERHEARRIDNQLRGRAGRQGDPGSGQFYVSLEDDLMRIFGGQRLQGIMKALHFPEDMPIENKLVSRSIEGAQTQIKEQKSKKEILEKIEDEIERVVSFHTAGDAEEHWNIKEICEVVNTIFPIGTEVKEKIENFRNKAGDKEQDAESRTKIIEHFVDLARKAYDGQEKKIEASGVGKPGIMRQIEKMIMLRSIDTLWIDHLEIMDNLKAGIGLRGYGQRDPLVEYKKESFHKFNQLRDAIDRRIVYSIYKVGIAQEMAPKEAPKDVKLSGPSKTMKKGQIRPPQIKPPKEAGPSGDAQPRQIDSKELKTSKEIYGKKIGRNDPCPCGATYPDGRPKKFKHCCGK
jgi:preprotein translocase subunit SecA